MKFYNDVLLVMEEKFLHKDAPWNRITQTMIKFIKLLAIINTEITKTFTTDSHKLISPQIA